MTIDTVTPRCGSNLLHVLRADQQRWQHLLVLKRGLGPAPTRARGTREVTTSTVSADQYTIFHAFVVPRGGMRSSYENSQSRGLFQLGRGYFHPFVATARHEQLS